MCSGPGFLFRFCCFLRERLFNTFPAQAFRRQPVPLLARQSATLAVALAYLVPQKHAALRVAENLRFGHEIPPYILNILK